MRTVDVDEPTTNLSGLLEEAARGEEVIITRAGRPIARVVPFNASKGRRTFGLLKGQIRIADDFDDPLPEDVLRVFE